MKLVVVSSALSHQEDLKPYAGLPAFRKASRKMTLSYDALNRALIRLPETFSRDQIATSGLVLNSGFGEIEATGGFLKGLADSSVARPIFFQNSLHNSTTGFLAIQLGIQGPVFTVNHRTEGGEEAIEIASTLLEEGLCEFCFLVSVETVPPEFGGAFGVDREGAAALVVCTEDTALKYQLSAVIESSTFAAEQSAKQTIELPLKGLKSLFKFDLITRVADLVSVQSSK